MSNRIFKIVTVTNPDESIVTGRNGTHKLAGISIWRSTNGSIGIDGIGRSGTVLNAGFYLDKQSAMSFFADLKAEFDIDESEA